MPLSQDAHDFLESKGFVHTTTNALAREKMAAVLKPQLIANHQITKYTDDAVDRYGATIDVLTRYVFTDDVDTLGDQAQRDLAGLVSHLTTTSVQGAVQKALTNGSPAFVLGSERVSRLFTSVDEQGNEIKRNISVTVRYVSKAEGVIKRLMLDPLIERTDRRAQRERGWLAMVEQRQPKLKRYITGDLLRGLSAGYQEGLGLLLPGDQEDTEED